jgi:hypothetical protein
MSKQLKAALYTLLTVALVTLVVLLVFIYPTTFGWFLTVASITLFVTSVYKLFCLYLKD